MNAHHSIPFRPEIIVDLFAGGGGASTGIGGKRLPKAAQVRMCGNSVCPPIARAIVAANWVEMAHIEEVAHVA